MKKIVLGFGIVVLIISACFIVLNFNKGSVKTELSSNTITLATSDKYSNVKTISSGVADMDSFSLEQLNSMSEIIVKGKAIEQSSFILNGFVFSKTKIKVEKVYKGNIKCESVLDIVEHGGITNEEEYYLKMLEEKTGKKATEDEKKKAKSNKIRVLFSGIEYSEVGKNSVYFLTKPSNEEFEAFSNYIDNNTYLPIGIHQGRFDIKDDSTLERPRGNCLPELKTTESDLLDKISKNKK